MLRRVTLAVVLRIVDALYVEILAGVVEILAERPPRVTLGPRLAVLRGAGRVAGPQLRHEVGLLGVAPLELLLPPAVRFVLTVVLEICRERRLKGKTARGFVSSKPNSNQIIILA